MEKNRNNTPQAPARAGRLERADVAIARAAAEHRCHPLVRALGFAAEAADQPPLIAVSLGTVAAGAAARNPRLVRAGLRMLAAELLATGIKGAVKRHVNRTRPNKMLEDGRYALQADSEGSRDVGPWNSFPSGHTAGAVAVGRALVREYPGAAPAAGAAMLAVALIQLPRGAHFPTDLVGGAIVGLAAEAVVDRAFALAAGPVEAPTV